eukprot:gene32032-38734_t
MANPYQIVATQIVHDGPVRSLAWGPTEGEILSGCQGDVPCVRRWRMNAESFEEIGSPLYHDHWITALTALSPDISREFYPEGCIISGCLDSKIRIFDVDGTLGQTLEGHSKGVISFSWTSTRQLLSGSWDGTAILWDVATGSLVRRFGPQENGVNVLALKGDLVATTSTGESVDGKPANFKLRIWNMTTGELVSTHEDHGGPIRSIAALPGVDGMLTSSNDGSVMLRSGEGQSIEQLLHPVQEDGTLPMVLNCTALASESGMDSVSCGEDGSVCVWQGTDLLQSLPHPNTVWTLLALPNDMKGGAFLTGGHDGALRKFSKDAELTSTSRVQQLANEFSIEVAAAQAARRRGPSAEEINKAPRWEQRGQHMGKKEDDVMVFNQDGKLIAAQWSSGSWVVIGEVTGSGDGGYIEDKWYDHVFPVEIETSTGLRTLKLGYNNQENPFVASQRFINTYQLDQFYLQQIADWIIQRTSQGSTPTLGSQGNASSAAVQAKPIAKAFSNPIQAYCVFDELPGNIGKVMTKIRDVNQSHIVKLSEEQLGAIEATLQTLTNTSQYHSSSLPTNIFVLLNVMLQWPAEHKFIPFDILRLAALHGQGAELLASSPYFRSFLQTAINTLQSSTSPHTAIMMVARFFANILRSEMLKRILLQQCSVECVSLLREIVGYTRAGNKLVRMAAVTVAFNVVAALKLYGNAARAVIGLGILQLLVQDAAGLLEVETDNAVAATRATQVIGSLFTTDFSTVGALSSQVKAAASKAVAVWQGKGASELVTSLQEIVALSS